MAIEKFKPQIWSARLLVALRKQLVYGAFINRDYEGEIKNAGDTVRITSIGRPTVSNYVPNSTVIVPEQLTDAQRSLVVDQSKYFAFGVDDVDAAQALGGALPQGMDEAAFAMADVVDQFISSKYTDIQAANQLTPVTIDASVKPTDAYDKVLVPLRTRLNKANVSPSGRTIAVTPDLTACLLLDPRFIKANESGTTDGLRNGQVGRAAGFDIVETNNAPQPTNGQFAIIAGNNTAITFAEQISKTEAYRPQNSFSDAIKGLALYGAKTIRPDSLASALVTVTNVG